jgi:hypothetical protein
VNGTKAVLSFVLIVLIYRFVQLPRLSDAAVAEMASRFMFQRQPLATIAHGGKSRSVRPVHPSLAGISSWVSSVGAAAAIADLDNDGAANDVCYVDVRSDQVVVAPLLQERYKPYLLELAGLDWDSSTMAPMGCLPGDVDEDGDTDLLVYYWGRTPVTFIQMSRGTYVPHELVAEGGKWYTNAATFADLNGDAHFDLIIGNYFPDGSRILDAHALGVENMNDSMSRASNGGRNRVLLWTGVNKFRDVSDLFDDAVMTGWTLAVGTADLDGDLRPEVYFANDFGPDRLLHNESDEQQLRFRLVEGVKTLTTPNSKRIGHDSFKGMGIDFGDINGDGWLDLYVSNIAEEYALQESHFLFVSTGAVDEFRKGIAPYTDRSEELGLARSGWAWDSRFADFDNDGVLEAVQATGFVRGSTNRWPELHETAMANDKLLRWPNTWHRFQPGDDLSGNKPIPFFVRAGNGRYHDVATKVGLATPHVGRGISLSDVDRDGRLDFVLANQWEPSFLYYNTSPNPGAFMGLRLTYLNNRPAVGAQATVILPDGRKLVSQVDGGNGHSGKRSSELHFGLGDIPANRRLRVEVAWRDSGGVHHRSYELAPGWHSLRLQSH